MDVYSTIFWPDKTPKERAKLKKELEQFTAEILRTQRKPQPKK